MPRRLILYTPVGFCASAATRWSGWSRSFSFIVNCIYLPSKPFNPSSVHTKIQNSDPEGWSKMHDGFLWFCNGIIKFDVIDKPKYSRSKSRSNVVIIGHHDLVSAPSTEGFQDVAFGLWCVAHNTNGVNIILLALGLTAKAIRCGRAWHWLADFRP